MGASEREGNVGASQDCTTSSGEARGRRGGRTEKERRQDGATKSKGSQAATTKSRAPNPCAFAEAAVAAGAMTVVVLCVGWFGLGCLVSDAFCARKPFCRADVASESTFKGGEKSSRFVHTSCRMECRKQYRKSAWTHGSSYGDVWICMVCDVLPSRCVAVAWPTCLSHFHNFVDSFRSQGNVFGY